jgi:hypothetical protein
MIWTIETNSGCFEGTRLKQVLNDMIEYYSEEGDSPQITEIFVTYENSKEREICDNGISKAQDFIDEGITEGYQSIQEEVEHQAQLRSDYYANLL